AALLHHRGEAARELSHRLEEEHAGVDRIIREVTREHRIVERDGSLADGEAVLEVDRRDAIDEKERIAVRHELLDLFAPEIDGRHLRRASDRSLLRISR